MDYTDALRRFEAQLIDEEKSPATIEKYKRDVCNFFRFVSGRTVDKAEVLAYKAYLTERYSPASVNSMLIAVNRFLRFTGHSDCCVRLLRIQRRIFQREDRELTCREYQQLLRAAGNTRIAYVLQTICGMGIRVSELRYITVQAVRKGTAEIHCKGKTRLLLIPQPIRSLLLQYIRKCDVREGVVFVTRSGRPLDRSNIWRDMKALCNRARVPASKVFPHNLRHLFARVFYSLDRDIVHLADLLGHSSINTTRIYTAESGRKCAARLEQVQKILTTQRRLCGQ